MGRLSTYSKASLSLPCFGLKWPFLLALEVKPRGRGMSKLDIEQELLSYSFYYGNSERFRTFRHLEATP